MVVISLYESESGLWGEGVSLGNQNPSVISKLSLLGTVIHWSMVVLPSTVKR